MNMYSSQADLVAHLSFSQCIATFKELVQNANFIQVMHIINHLNLRHILLTYRNIRSVDDIKTCVWERHGLETLYQYQTFFSSFVLESKECSILFESSLSVNDYSALVVPGKKRSRKETTFYVPISSSKKRKTTKGNEQKEFKVERIVNHVNTDNFADHHFQSNLAPFDFCVKWEGYPHSENLWLPYSEVKDTAAFQTYMALFA